MRELDAAVAGWRERGWPAPRVVVVSGSGLAVDLAPPGTERHPLAAVLPFEVAPVIGHPHSVELFEAPVGTVAYFRGRLHAYQGYDAHRTVLVVRLAARLGARTLVMTNASGGLDPGRLPGTLVAIRDHLNLSGLNPLRGELPPEWGPRFPDLLNAYDPALRELARGRAGALGFELPEGVYAGLAGPSYETAAEIRMLATLGADLVGMSTVLEVIAARQMGLRCLCLSLVSNLAAGVTDRPLHHDEVLGAGREAAIRVGALLGALLSDGRLAG